MGVEIKQDDSDGSEQYVVVPQPVVYQYMCVEAHAEDVEAPQPIKFTEGLNALGEQGWMLLTKIKNEIGRYNIFLVRTGIVQPKNQPQSNIIPISPKITGPNGRPL